MPVIFTMKRHLQITADGSHTIAIPNLQVVYHSKHGAIGESNHVFINAGLKHCIMLQPNQPIQIFEMGFGTGLNCLLTAIYAREHQISIQYNTIEAFPLLSDEVAALNHGDVLGSAKLFQEIHQSDWNKATMPHPFFQLHKHQSTLQQFSTDLLFDCIFYDAFAPSAQPELWTEETFLQLFSMLKPGGFLVTYCSKTVVRRAMLAAGFRVTKIQGPFGKREMVRAFKDA